MPNFLQLALELEGKLTLQVSPRPVTLCPSEFSQNTRLAKNILRGSLWELIPNGILLPLFFLKISPTMEVNFRACKTSSP